MKIVRTKEDIIGDMYCAATKENYEKLIELGYDRLKYADKFYEMSDYMSTDIIQIISESVYMCWYDVKDRRGSEFKFEELDNKFSVTLVGFIEPTNFDAKIFSCYESDDDVIEYIGVVNKNIPAKWGFEGVCLNPSKGYSLYKEYKQVLYTKENVPGFIPKQKFKVSCTSGMSKSLEEGGWRKATNKEIQSFMS